MRVEKKKTHVAVPAPEGFSWTEDRGRFYLKEGKSGAATAKFRLKQA